MGERGLGVGAPRCPCLLCCGRGEGTLHDPARTKYPCVHFLSLLIFLPHPSSQKRKLRPRGVLSFAQSRSDGQHQKQIDYILCSQRCRSSIQSAKTRLGDDCGSDHELLLATSSYYLLLLLGPYHFCPLLCPSLHEEFPWYL